MRRTVNFVVYNLVWLVSLIGAGSGYPWLGALALAGFMAWHFRQTTTPRADLLLVLAAAGAGLVCDTLYIQSGLLAYAAPLPWQQLAPFWIVAMWMNFGLTLNESLAWMRGRPVLGALLGVVGGPLAYIAGIKLGAAEMTAESWRVMGVVALTWGVAVPLLLSAAERVSRLPEPAGAFPPPAGRGLP